VPSRQWTARSWPSQAGCRGSRPAPQPFTVAEYFPTPGVTPFHDPRQHAVSLAYVVPVEGDCEPQQDALELTWFSPLEVRARPCSPN
jgi:ADP-ribose pyrophosphatase YjhB (NUDIX family)